MKIRALWAELFFADVLTDVQYNMAELFVY
jgi:hypothetical protein